MTSMVRGASLAMSERLCSALLPMRLSSGETNADGRLASLMPIDDPLIQGVYRITFDTGRYFQAQGRQAFYPEVVVVFETVAGESHYHVPLLLSPFGYSTYRGT